jgi:hypothetical protein
MALATLSIDLVAQLARFEADMGRAARAAETAAQRMDRAFTGVGAVFTGSLLASAAATAARELANLVPELVNSVARFQDLEEITGASATALAGFQTAADVSGTSIDTLAGFMVKLTGTLSKTNDETKGAGAALKALGLDMEAFRALAPEEQFLTIAQRLNTFRDGAGKTAIAIALLGKSGAEALPFFKELANAGLSQVRVNAEQIRQAYDLIDKQAKLRSELRQAAQLVALQMLPAFNELTRVFVDVARQATGLEGSLDGLSNNSGIRSFAEGLAEGLAVVADAAVFATKAIRLLAGAAPLIPASLNVVKNLADPQAARQFAREGTGPLKEAYDERARLVEAQEKRLKDLIGGDDFAISNQLRNRFATTKLGESVGLNDIDKLLGGTGDQRPKIDFRAAADADKGAANKAARDLEQARRARLEQNLKAIEGLFASERDAVQFQQRFLQAEQGAGLVSLDDYYTERKALNDRALQVELEGYAERVRALQAYNATLKPGSDDRIKGETRVAEEEAKAARARQEYAQQASLDAIAQRRDYEQLADGVRAFKAQLLDLQGDTAGAARLRADQAIDTARRSARSQGLAPADVSGFEAATNASLRLAEAQRQVQRATQDAGIEEQRFLIAAEAAGATRAETEQGVFRIRAQALEQVREQLRLAEALAVSASPDSPAVQFARELRLEFERLNAAVDPALLRLRQVGDEVAESLGRAASAISLNFRDAKSAVKSLGDSLLQISTRELVERPLSDFFRQQIRQLSEGGGGIGQAVRGLFGVGGTAAAAPAAAGGGLNLGGLFGDAGAAPALSGGGFNFGSLLSGALGGGGGSGAASATVELGNLALAAQSAALALSAIGGPGGGLLGASGAGQIGGSSAFDFIGDSFIKLFGLADGGYTGPGGKDVPAGVVHKGEVVWSQADIGRAGGVAVVEGMRLGRRGYADGGVVDMPRVLRGGFQSGSPAGARAGGRGGGGTTVNLGGVTVESGGYMDSMAEDRAAQRIALKAQRYMQRRGA